MQLVEGAPETLSPNRESSRLISLPPFYLRGAAMNLSVVKELAQFSGNLDCTT